MQLRAHITFLFRSITVVFALFGTTQSALAEDTEPAQFDHRLTPLLGMIQPIVLGGGNVELDWHYRRLVVSYSHGFQLGLEGNSVVGDAYDQGLALDIPISTGFGVGYRITRWLDVRLEGKWHRFAVRYDDRTGLDGDTLFRYDTYTVGAGMYASWRPFERSESWTRGLTTVVSLRFWPNVATTLDDNEQDYENAHTGLSETHEASNIGIANTPVIFNVGIGYSFELPDRARASAATGIEHGE